MCKRKNPSLVLRLTICYAVIGQSDSHHLPMISCSRATVEILVHDTTENEGSARARAREFSIPNASLVRTTQDGESRFYFFSDHNHLLFDVSEGHGAPRGVKIFFFVHARTR